jgi:hypothetical protein
MGHFGPPGQASSGESAGLPSIPPLPGEGVDAPSLATPIVHGPSAVRSCVSSCSHWSSPGCSSLPREPSVVLSPSCPTGTGCLCTSSDL